MKKQFLCLLLVLTASLVAFPAAAAQSDPLPRRGVLGAAVVQKDARLAISVVVPGSAAAQAGFIVGDVIANIDGKSTASVADFFAQVRRPGGQPLTLTVSRSGTLITKTLTLPEAARERDAAVDTLYESVTVDDSLRRVLITVPHKQPTGAHPAVFFVGGIGCFSIDNANPQDAYRNLSHDLSKRGFVTLRLEKSGVGDSQGPACSSVDLLTEMHSYAVALDAFRTNPLIDPHKIYLFGHSIGSVIAPRLAQSVPVAGLIVAEGVGRNWFEYELINTRRQLPLTGMSAKDIDPAMQLKELCTHKLEIDKESRSAILAQLPDCSDYFADYPVPDAYMQQVAALNIQAPWMQVRVPTLVIYGGSDFITDEADHRLIADLINAGSAGRATLRIIPNMDHYLGVASSQQQSFDRASKRLPGMYNRRMSDSVIGWICKLQQCTAGDAPSALLTGSGAPMTPDLYPFATHRL